MKTTIQSLMAGIFVAVSLQIHAQGTLVYDQQTTNAPSRLGDYFNLQADSPLLQSFVPALSAIGFAQFQFWDIYATNGATVEVNLWEGSPNTNSDILLGSTTPVYMPEGFGVSTPGVTNFYFSTPITLIAGDTYYLQPAVLYGDNPYGIKVNNDAPMEDYYPNGDLFANNGVDVGIDLWFREGVVVPEPSALALIGLAGLLIFAFKRRRILLPIVGLFATTFAHASIVYFLQSLGGIGSVPFPMNPYDSNSVPVEEVSPGISVVQDGAPSGGGRFHAMDYSIPPSPGGTNSSGTNQTYQISYIHQSYTSNDLWLSIISGTNGIAQLVIHPPWDEVDSNWDLFYTTNLATPYSNWLWI